MPSPRALLFAALIPLLGCSGGGEADCLNLELVDASVDAPAAIELAFTATTCSGYSAGALDPGAVALYEDGVPLSPYESQLMMGDPDAVFAFRSVLLLDVSGSVLESGALPPLQEAAAAYVADVGADHAVAIGVFDGRREVEWLTDFTADGDVLLEAIIDLADREVIDSATNLYGAAIAGLDALDGVNTRDRWLSGSLAIFTDGAHSVGEGDGYPGYQELLGRLEAAPHAVYTLGLGTAIDYEVLSTLGRDGFLAAASEGDLGAAFADIAGEVSTRAQSHHVLSYCSPARAGDHTLTLEAISAQGLTGALDFNFDATGFSGGCSTE